MDVGVVSRSFPERTNEEVASLLADNGFKWTELCFYHPDADYWVYNGRSDLSTLTDEKSRKIIESYRNKGITVSALGVFTNLVEPERPEMEKNLKYFERYIEIAAANGVPCVSTECGFVPGERGVNADTYEEDFSRLKHNMKYLLERAEKHGVDIALEPCVLDVVPSAKRMADFIQQLGSDHLKVLLDPANLIANSSEEDMFKYLAPHIAYFHGKDRKVNDAYGRVVGDGDIDWPKFLKLYHQQAEGVPFILEYVDEDNFCAIRDRVLEYDQAIG